MTHALPILIAAATIAFAQAPAAAERPPATLFAPVDAGSWQKLLEKVKGKGVFRVTDPDAGRSAFTFYDVRGETWTAHQADYFSLRGGGLSQDDFVASSADMVSEDWSVTADGNWNIDQWYLRFELDGSLAQSYHRVLVETPDRYVLDEREYRETPDSTAAKLNALLKSWAAFEPK